MAADYWRSTQANSWLLDPLDLDVARAEDVRYAGDKDNVAAATIFLASAISSLSKRLHLRQRVTATATIFFHRFYSVPPNGYTNTDPCLVATACVYVASKAEETPIHVRTVMHEAIKMWTEYGHPCFPASSVDLAEMEFYLLRDLDYHLILHHPYRPLLQLAGTVGKAAVERAEANAAAASAGGSGGASSSAGSSSSSSSSSRKTGMAPSTAAAAAAAALRGSPSGLGIHADALGINSSKLGLPNFDMTAASGSKPTTTNGEAQEDSMTREDRREEEAARKALSGGDFGLPTARVEEIDQDVVQMAWFILNDTYRHAHLHLLYPPYILALAALCLALVLHDPSREKLLASVAKMEGRRKRARREGDEDEDHAGRGEAGDSGSEATKTKQVKTEEAAGTRRTSASASAATASVATSAAAPPAASSSSSSPARTSRPLPRPAHLPPKPVTASSSRPPPSRSPLPTHDDAHNTHGVSSSSSSSTTLPGSTAHLSTSSPPTSTSTTVPPQGPTPPSDALTFLSLLNLSPRTQLAECIQSILEGYATWKRCLGLLEGKAVVARLHAWRKRREEELRVLELEGVMAGRRAGAAAKKE